MAKIYISSETLKKLSQTNNNSKILKRFDANRPEPKQHSNSNNPKQSKNKTTKQSKLTSIRRITLRHPPKKVKEKPIVKHLMSEITEHRYQGITERSNAFFVLQITRKAIL